MKETVYYLNEAEAKAHGEVKAVVSLLRVHRLKPASEKPMETEVVAEATTEVMWDEDARELEVDEAVEVEKTYYKVVLS
jgi:hypothetical protein